MGKGRIAYPSTRRRLFGLSRSVLHKLRLLNPRERLRPVTDPACTLWFNQLRDSLRRSSEPYIKIAIDYLRIENAEAAKEALRIYRDNLPEMLRVNRETPTPLQHVIIAEDAERALQMYDRLIAQKRKAHDPQLQTYYDSLLHVFEEWSQEKGLIDELKHVKEYLEKVPARVYERRKRSTPLLGTFDQLRPHLIRQLQSFIDLLEKKRA